MINSESIKQKILETRGRDKAKGYTHTLMHSSLACSTLQALQNLCEEADKLEVPLNTRFLIRTIFAAYVIKSGDMMILNQNLANAALTTLQHVIKLTVSEEEQAKILQKLGTNDLMEYYNSQHHQQIIQDLHHVIGHDFEMSTPYDFADLMLAGLGLLNFKKNINELMNMTILLPQACKLTAEEIFVGTCLYVCQKYSCSKIYSLLEEFFPNSMSSSEDLMTIIKSAFQTFEANS